MAAKNWAYTSLAGNTTLQLVLNGITYAVSQFVGTWGLNQVPEAMCTLAVGRDAFNATQEAAIHNSANTLTTMLPAKIILTMDPSNEFTPDGQTWPGDAVTIFEGYYVGYGYQNDAAGKISLVVHLIHWLADLGFSSTLSSIISPLSPNDLTFSAVTVTTDPSGAGGGIPVFNSQLVGDHQLSSDVQTDLWVAIQKFLYSMAQYTGYVPACGPAALPGVTDTFRVNTRATIALQRMEGAKLLPAASQGGQVQTGGSTYVYAMPLTLVNSLITAGVFTGIANAIGYIPIANLAQQSYWDLLLGDYCQTFSMELAPLSDRALVVASLPGYRGKNGKYWRTLSPDDYNFIDDSAMLPKPLRGVAVHGATMSQTGVTPASTMNCLGGVFASMAQSDGDGAILFQAAPQWAAAILQSGAPLNAANSSTGIAQNAPSNTATGGGGVAPTEPIPTTMNVPTQNFMAALAQSIFVINSLRGRAGTITGKLRFDIGPGSHIAMVGVPEKFLTAQDALAANRYAHVNRVTVEIDAEGRRAATAFALTHMRNGAENASDRTSIAAHPFYGDNVCLGAPLVPAYAMPAAGDPINATS